MNTTALKGFYITIGIAGLLLVPQLAGAQAGIGPVNRTLDRSLGQRLPPIDRRVEDELESRARRVEEAARQAPTGDGIEAAAELVGPVTDTAEAALAAGVGTVSHAGSGLLRAFVADVDPFGNPIEQNTLVVLIPQEQVAALRARGLNVVDEQVMPVLGLTRLTLRSAQPYRLADDILELQKAFPDAAVDYNHLYRWQSENSTGKAVSEPAVDSRTADARDVMRIGLIDSAIEAQHAALREVQVAAQSFARHEGIEPVGHGTAVASLLARAADRPLTIYAASVFFQVAGHAPGASTESLLEALDWLASKDVAAINMSLAGPPNGVLERALQRLREMSGPVVVAAVGNNGPAGEPMYPGAYDSVVGITAVDRDDKVFRYANRGPHVDFAALGVDVKVANAGGGWRLESGTSMAAPRVAAAVAALTMRGTAEFEDLQSLLKGSARDLGRPGFDPVYGHGLVTGPPEIVSRVKTPRPD